MLKTLLFFLSIISISITISNNLEANIITFRRYSMRKTENITTKYNNISIQFDSKYDKKNDMWYYIYVIENLKNLNLFSFPDLNCTYELYGANNNSLKIIFKNEIINKYNNLITRLFYEIKYIDRMIYAIGYDGYYCKYDGNYYEHMDFVTNFKFRFYGGAPNRITKNLIKNSFSPKDTVKEININYLNGRKINIQIDKEKKGSNLVEFNENNFFICFPEYILEQIKDLILKDLKVRKDGIGLDDYLMYDINYKVFNSFPENITFKIGNRIIIIYKEYLSPDFRHNDLFIQYTPCEHFVIGYPFLRFVDMREYNFETNETNLYLRKNNSIIIEEKEMKINSYKFSYFIFIFMAFSLINVFIFWRKKNREKNAEEFKEYYII